MKISNGYGTLPLSFERNQGQADGAVRFLARGPGYSVLLKESGATLLLSRHQPVPADFHRLPLSQVGNAQAINAKTDTLRMRLIGGSAMSRVTGDEQLPGTVNYFTGSDPAKWIAGVPTFAKVRYRGVYPGINLVYYGSRQQLEFDFQIAPGADPRRIRFRFDGASKLALDRNGSLKIVEQNGEIQFHKPEIFQPLDGGGRQPVPGAFYLSSENTVSFRLGPYDNSRPLIIDPILSYSTYLGLGDGAKGIAVDSLGNAYVAGSVIGYGSVPASGGIQPNFPTKSPNSSSAFVAKLNSTGTALVYCTYLSGSGVDAATGISVDSAGDAYVAGTTSSTDFSITPGALQTTFAGGFNLYTGFVTEINSSGTALIYSTYLGGTGATKLDGIAVDSSGSAYLTGYTTALDFPTTAGAFQPANKATASVTQTGFISKLNSGGTGLLYSTYLGGTTQDEPSAIAVDAVGDAYITGATLSTDFPTTTGAYQLVNKGKNAFGTADWNSFVTKMNQTGTSLVYSTYLGGSFTDFGIGIALDSSGSAYVAGVASSSDFPTTPGAYQPSATASGPSIFVTKFNTLGTGLVYSTFLGRYPTFFGATNYEWGGIAVDASGNAYITGITDSFDYPVTPGALQTQNTSMLASGLYSSILTEVSSTGTELVYSTYLSGSGYVTQDEGPADAANGIALDSSGNVYLAGHTASSDFPTTQGVLQTVGTVQDIGDDVISPSAFVTKFNSSEMKSLPVTTATVTASANPQAAGSSVTFTVKIQSTSGTKPTGTVGFSTSEGSYPSDMSPWSTVSLNGSGSATFTTSTLPQGTDAIIAYYLGDANNAPSSGSITETITSTDLLLPVSVTVTSTLNPAQYGIPVVFHVSVKDPSGKGQPQGWIQPALNYLSLTNEIALDTSGNATWTTSSLTPGSDDIDFNFYSSNNNYSSGLTYFTENITPLGTATAPVITPASGVVNSSAQTVTITESATGPIIFYEILPEGSTVTPFSGNPYLLGYAGYTGPITITASQTVAAAAYQPGYNWSPTVSTNYVLAPIGQAPTPTFSPAAGTYTSAQSVSIKDSVASASIYYTTNGTGPTTQSTLYSGAISVSANETIQAIAVATGYTNSTVGTAAYIINLPPPSFTVTGTAVTVTPGANTGNTSTITLTPSGGFTGTVSLQCAITPTAANDPAMCGVPNSVTISGGSAQTATLTVSTTQATSAFNRNRKLLWSSAGGATLACILLVGIPARRRRWRSTLGILALLFFITGGVLACGGSSSGGGGGGGGNSGTTPGTYTITVTGTSGAITETGLVSLTVQ